MPRRITAPYGTVRSVVAALHVGNNSSPNERRALDASRLRQTVPLIACAILCGAVAKFFSAVSNLIDFKPVVPITGGRGITRRVIDDGGDCVRCLNTGSAYHGW